MARACVQCGWYSPDEVEVCSHCGEPLPDADAEEFHIEQPASPAAVAWQWLQFFLGLGLLGLMASIAYARYGARLTGGVEVVREGSRTLWTWLIGAEGQYADFIVIALLASLAFWFVLWVFNRLQR